MLRAFLFPISVALSALLLQVLVSRSKGAPTGECPEFRFSKGLRLFLWISILAVSVGLLALVPWDSPQRTQDLLVCGGMAILGFTCCVYAERFVLRLWDDHFSYGAFKTYSVDYKDMVSAEMSVLGSGKRFLVIKTSKKRIAISGYLSSVDDAARLLKSKLSAVPKR